MNSILYEQDQREAVSEVLMTNTTDLEIESIYSTLGEVSTIKIYNYGIITTDETVKCNSIPILHMHAM